MKKKVTRHSLILIFLALLLFTLFFVLPRLFGSVSYKQGEQMVQEKQEKKQNSGAVVVFPPLDKVAYDTKMLELANNPSPPEPTTKIVKDPKTGEKTTVVVPAKPAPAYPWPVKAVYPNAGAILPFNRIIAYYGNLYSKKMGVLGEYPEGEMLAKLNREVKKWEAADPKTPVVPALHYIAVVAQGSPGKDGQYRARMPDSEIDKVLAIADKIPARPAGGNGIVFLDIQVGFSTIEVELPRLEKYLKLPNVHLGMDAEFSMKTGIRPGKIVGTFDAADINFAANYLAKIVKENNLPPKVLVVHRYTQKMITNYKAIKPLPEVQIVMHMDGWGGKAKKIGTNRNFIYPEPVQFTGFKLFYKNDVLTPGTTLMTPEDLLKLSPRPIYIQYQ
ncbi:MAG: hypothetical protein UU66_C0003G0014 [Parcubacteria group bacterium GW2011_GWB1_41_5]|nr:MAG: hypothetical protein UU66_C0003G0014 [Parcubacteria group bacterium GW2011_GWB1_41_5]